MNQRPLSPHLQVYRLPLVALLSISHRATGVLLSLAALSLVIWLAAAADSSESFAYLQQLVSSWLGQIILFGFIATLCYHMLNGLRHLMWDFGFGLDIRHAEISGLLVVAGSILLSALIWFLS